MRTLLIAAALALAALTAAAQPSREECLACHDTVHAEKFGASVHAPLDCTGCHADIKDVPHDPAPKKVDCASCHVDAVEAWNHSLHAKAAAAGRGKGPQCQDCHGSAHEIQPMQRAKIPQICSSCHGQKFVMQKAGLSAQPAISYQESVHGRAVAKGSTRAAVCTDCHDSHNVRPANDPLSGIFKFNVGRTCGQCHAAIAGQYHDSVHGKALARGNGSTPVCTDCHGIHTISTAADPLHGPRASCIRCHEGVRLNEELGVAGARVSSYKSSYHGLARQLGSTTAADCASCHGTHNILPSSDPRSAVHPANLQKTCGKCHEGAQANFARGKVHRSAGETDDTGSFINTWVRRVYIVLIVLTIGVMALHNLLIWWRKAQAARRASGRTVVRMNLNQRIQHSVLVLSFVVLVITGFALAWPDSVLARICGPEAVRRLIHRIAAVVMIILGIYHLGYMTLTREGRQGLRDFWFRFSDGKDLIAVMRNRHPQAGRFTYAEKAEYWAGLWGTIVMAITGLVIWYSVGVATWIPRWWIDIATTVHYYEAILATLAIIVWHLYHVIFDPGVYPMNWAWLDGKVSKEEFEKEHPLAHQKAQDESTKEGNE
jgi:formate dehydrogenase gamma subunit